MRLPALALMLALIPCVSDAAMIELTWSDRHSIEPAGSGWLTVGDDPFLVTAPLATPLPWDLVSGGYESDIVPMFESYARDALRLSSVTASHAVLDVAAGPGTLALLAAPDVARVEAIDFSPRMVERLERRVPSFVHASNTRDRSDR